MSERLTHLLPRLGRRTMATLGVTSAVMLAACSGNPTAPSATGAPGIGTTVPQTFSGVVQNGGTTAVVGTRRVSTDQGDYSPGSVVTISGDNSNGIGYVPGNTVNVAVTGPNGWSSSCSAIVGFDGSWSCQITLSADPAIAVGEYSYTATSTNAEGAPITEIGAFTDGPLRNWVFVVAGTGTGSVLITPSDGTIKAPVACGGTGSDAASQSVESSCVNGGAGFIVTSDSDATVTFNATADAGSTFAGWSNPNGLTSSTCTGTTNPCTAVIGTNASLTATFNLNAVANVPPTAEANGPYIGNEGSAVSLSSAGSTDSDGTIASYAWTYAIVAADAGASCSFSNAAAANPTITCTDDGIYTVKLKVTDDDNAESAEDTASLTLSNVKPVVNTPTKVSDSNCTIDISASFTDAGSNDTHTATIHWGDLIDSAGVVTEPSGSTPGTVTGSHTYAVAGAYNITVTVTDDDGGAETSSALVYNNSPALTYPLPPIFDPNKTYKNGSTIPVKIKATGCTAGLTPRISITPTAGQPGVNSSGKSNVDDILRYTPDLPGFIYNWSTKGWTDQTYTVKVSGLPGTVTISDNVTLVK